VLVFIGVPTLAAEAKDAAIADLSGRAGRQKVKKIAQVPRLAQTGCLPDLHGFSPPFSEANKERAG
jgi:hypothetical protein